jgi:translation initiation factor 2 subunit 2
MEDLPLVDFTKVKKKRTKMADLSDFITKKGPKKQQENESKEAVNKGIDNQIDNKDLSTDEGEDLSYDFLLQRIYSLIRKNNRDILEKSKVSIPIPIINRVGTSRSVWVNFSNVYTSLNRPQDHLFQFILSELGVEGSLGGESQFLLKGRYNNKHIETLLKKYVIDYVQCNNCKSSQTILKRDNSARIQVMSCNSCGSERTVSAIKVNQKKK